MQTNFSPFLNSICLSFFVCLFTGCTDKKEISLMSQSVFWKTVEEKCVKYDNAINQANATQIRKERKYELSKFSGHFQRWMVTVSSIETNSNGDAKVSFILHSDSKCSSIILYSKINPNHNSYKILLGVRVGEMLNVSGFMNSNNSNLNHFYESSITEKGSMQDPEFEVKISKIENL
jgi:hypothetical protein